MKWSTALAVASALVVFPATQCVCPDGWEDFGENGSTGPCLYFVPVRSSWHGMRDICRELGGDLAKLNDHLHHQVAEYITERLSSDFIDGFWIGGTDSAAEGSWKWVIDDTDIPLGTPHWYPCDDQSQPTEDTTQNYLSLYPPDYFFHGLESSRQSYGICRIFQ